MSHGKCVYSLLVFAFNTESMRSENKICAYDRKSIFKKFDFHDECLTHKLCLLKLISVGWSIGILQRQKWAAISMRMFAKHCAAPFRRSGSELCKANVSETHKFRSFRQWQWRQSRKKIICLSSNVLILMTRQGIPRFLLYFLFSPLCGRVHWICCRS